MLRCPLAQIVAVLIGLAASGTPVAAQTIIGVLEGGPVQLHGTLSVSGGKPEIQSGSIIEVRNGEARLLLARGGYARLCGPLRATFLIGGGDALLITIERGAVELRYAARPFDSVATPDFDLTLVVPAGEIGIASASISVDSHGQMCVNNRASVLQVIDRWAGHSYQVRDAERLLFVPEKVPVPANQECGCSPSAPVPVLPLAATTAPRPAPQAQATLSYPERPPAARAPQAPTAATPVPVATRPAGAVAKKTPTKSPNKPKKRGNVLERFFRKIFGR